MSLMAIEATVTSETDFQMPVRRHRDTNQASSFIERENMGGLGRW